MLFEDIFESNESDYANNQKLKDRLRKELAKGPDRDDEKIKNLRQKIANLDNKLTPA